VKLSLHENVHAVHRAHALAWQRHHIVHMILPPPWLALACPSTRRALRVVPIVTATHIQPPSHDQWLFTCVGNACHILLSLGRCDCVVGPVDIHALSCTNPLLTALSFDRHPHHGLPHIAGVCRDLGRWEKFLVLHNRLVAQASKDHVRQTSSGRQLPS
jgi:hypothetical protein